MDASGGCCGLYSTIARAEEGKSYYVFALLSCGDDIGRTDLYLAKLLAEKGYRLDAVWSFSMPNTYIALPFFDVDSEDLAKQKVEATRLKLVQAAQAVQVRKSGVVDVIPRRFCSPEKVASFAGSSTVFGSAAFICHE